MRISLIGYGFVSWEGGVDFLRMIALELAAADPERANPKQIIIPASGAAEAHWRGRFADLADDFDLVFAGEDYSAQYEAADAFGADVVLPCMYLPPAGFQRPWLSYAYDFQHRHYPGFFAPEELRDRDQRYADMLHQAKHVICYSQTVKADAERFFGAFPARIHVLPFAPYAEPGWLEPSEDVRAMYGIDRPYFLVSNRFWIHKDHPTALRAFGQFLKDGGDALLVLTGEVNDYRVPDYATQLQAIVEETGVGPSLRVLGHIPKANQIALIKRAVTMIQPTLFEGGPGGGAAHNAIALGTSVIASDIPVNRELDCGAVTFFRAGDHMALAASMRHHASVPVSRPSDARLQAQGRERIALAGRVLMDAVQQAVDDL
jgi:glycosyltransferase involved in cell wall biosynthesis